MGADNKELKEAIKSLKEFAYTMTGTFSMKEAKIILNYIENSIPKEKVLKKIELLNNLQLETMENKLQRDSAVKSLYELLEDK